MARSVLQADTQCHTLSLSGRPAGCGLRVRRLSPRAIAPMRPDACVTGFASRATSAFSSTAPNRRHTSTAAARIDPHSSREPPGLPRRASPEAPP
ncbi:Hypothetical protein SCLAV_5061 [Streptomyces clavuligerus]|uniref:Uncharacterized protein n=1 Tax=Streptomyces clavuligerus TaxID=1901 RepID=E2PX57_STRCL|nr:Hypothetical protein SCLAV_5061 [Streptomyces clavuligerus]